MDVEGHELAVLDGMSDLLAGADAPAIVIEGNGFTLAGAGLVPGDLVRRLHDFGLQTWRIGDHELFRVGPDDLQPETVCDYLASRSEPPWPERPAPDADAVATRFVAEGGHALWTHRRYVAGVLVSAPPDLVARPEIQDLMERLLIDPVPAVHAAAVWWLEQPEAEGSARSRNRRGRSRPASGRRRLRDEAAVVRVVRVHEVGVVLDEARVVVGILGEDLPPTGAEQRNLRRRHFRRAARALEVEQLDLGVVHGAIALRPQLQPVVDVLVVDRERR